MQTKTPNQRWFNASPPSTTLDQRHTKIDSTSRVHRAPTFENIASRSPGKTRDHVSKRLHRLGRRPNNKTRSVQYSWDVCGWCSDKKEGFSSVLTLSKKKNHLRTVQLDPQRAGFMAKPNIIKDMVVRKKYCMYIPKHTLTGCISLSNGGWREII